MDPKEIFVGRKVWLKPNPKYRDLYTDDYFETEVTVVGLELFGIKDPNRRSSLVYRINTMKENSTSPTKGEVFLSIDGVEDFERIEQKLIKIRRYFNSRLCYNELESNLDEIIRLLNL